MRRDPWFFQRWALEQRVGNPTRKLVLNTLAVMAETNTGYCFAKQEDLAFAAECSIRTVADHLKILERDFWIARRRRHNGTGHRAADGFLLLAPGVVEWPDGTPIPTRENCLEADPASGSPAQGLPEDHGVEQERPENTPQGKGARADAREDDQLPADFPVELVPHARAAFRVLRDLAEAHRAQAVSPRALGAVIMARPRHPIVRAAHDCYAHFIDRRPPRRDVVACYRNWLDKCDELAATEPLPGEDVAPRAGVTSLDSRRGAAQSDAAALGDRVIADALAGSGA